MRKTILYLGLLSLALACKSPEDGNEQPPQTPETPEVAVNPEVETIKALILDSYVEGLQNEGDTNRIDAGFHPDFAMTGRGDNDELWHFKISDWRQRKIERRAKGELPLSGDRRVSAKFDMVDISDDVALVKLRYFEGGKHTYTDYISLYQIQGEWKIIAKIFTEIEA